MKYVIVGASAAGAQAAEDLRKLDPEADIQIITEESGPPYSRCLLSRLADGRLQERDLYFKTARFAEDRRLRYVSGVRVERINAASRNVVCSHGETVAYDELLLATGSRPWIPDIPGRELDGVIAFHSLKDARAIAVTRSASRRRAACSTRRRG